MTEKENKNNIPNGHDDNADRKAGVGSPRVKHKKISAAKKRLHEFIIWLNQNEKIIALKEHLVKSRKDLDKHIEDDPWLRKHRGRLRKYTDKARRHKGRAIAALIVLILLIVAGNIIFPLKKKVPQSKRVIRADAFLVKRVDFEDKLPAMGLVRGVHSADLGFQVNGIVSKVNFHEGQMVQKGDIIATLDDTDARLKVEYNQSKVNAGKKKVEVHEKLYQLKSIIKAKLDEVKYEYESQVKELEFAKQELTKTKLPSPATGLLGPIEVEEGETVTPHTKVTSVYNVGTVFIDLGIIEKDISRIKLGQKVEVNVDAYPGVTKIGKIVSVSPVIEGKSRNFKVRVKAINDDPSMFFLPGMFARADIYVYSSENTIVAPFASVKNNTVYRIIDDIVSPQKVRTGYSSYDYIEILEGLKDDDIIVAEIEGDLSKKPRIEIINTRKYTDRR